MLLTRCLNLTISLCVHNVWTTISSQIIWKIDAKSVWQTFKIIVVHTHTINGSNCRLAFSNTSVCVCVSVYLHLPYFAYKARTSERLSEYYIGGVEGGRLKQELQRNQKIQSVASGLDDLAGWLASQ